MGTKQMSNKSRRPAGSKVFGGRKAPKIDQKAIEKVHKNPAGTDFDFENEFDDDVSSSPKPDLKSIRPSFRETSKKAPIYMKETEQIPPVPDFEDDFEDKVPYRPKGFKQQLQQQQSVEEETVPKLSMKSLKKQLTKRAEED